VWRSQYTTLGLVWFNRGEGEGFLRRGSEVNVIYVTKLSSLFLLKF
jgi:hypothetical protein